MSTKRLCRKTKRAFTLIELLMVIVIIALLISILLPALTSARKSARAAICRGNMKMFNLGFQNYAGDAKGSMASFTWQRGVITPSDYPDNRIIPADATQAHARQAVEYARQLKPDTPLLAANVADNRMMARNYTQLVLMYGGYYGDRLPEPAVACSEDRNLLIWQKLTPQQAQTQYAAWDVGAPPAFLPFYSSYQIIPNAFQEEKGPGQIHQAMDDYRLYTFYPGSSTFRQRRMDAVSFPGQKVVWFDLFDRHSYSRPIFYAYKIAKQPLAFFDGSVQFKATKDANLGWNHQATQQNNLNVYSEVYYQPMNPDDPAPLYTTDSANVLPSYYRWTRQGVRGVDFGGQEVTK